MSSDVGWHIRDQCRSMVQYSFTSTETRRLVRTDCPGRPPRLSHSSWTMIRRWGKRDTIYLLLHCHHKNDSSIKMGSDESSRLGSLERVSSDGPLPVLLCFSAAMPFLLWVYFVVHEKLNYIIFFLKRRRRRRNFTFSKFFMYNKVHSLVTRADCLRPIHSPASFPLLSGSITSVGRQEVSK